MAYKRSRSIDGSQPSGQWSYQMWDKRDWDEFVKNNSSEVIITEISKEEQIELTLKALEQREQRRKRIDIIQICSLMPYTIIRCINSKCKHKFKLPTEHIIKKEEIILECPSCKKKTLFLTQKIFDSYHDHLKKAISKN